MSEDANHIWEKFDFFIKDSLKYFPEGYKYIDLNKYPKNLHEKIILETMDFIVSHEKNSQLREMMGDWYLFLNSDEHK